MTVIAVFGPRNSYKSSFALSMPGRKLVFDLEYGAKRAARTYPQTENDFEIWQPPKQDKEEILKAFMAKSSGTLQGRKEKYRHVVRRFVDACDEPEWEWFVFDTAKELWEMNCQGFLQEIQEEIETNNTNADGKKERKEQRKSLLQIEYRTPNEQMRQFFHTVNAYGKNLLLINHSRPVYKRMQNPSTKQMEMAPSDDYEIDGFNQTKNLADWVIEACEDSHNAKKKWAVVRKSPIGPVAIDLEFKKPFTEGGADSTGYDYPLFASMIKKIGGEVMV